MDIVVLVGMIAALVIISLGVGRLSARGNLSKEHYALARRKIPFLPLMLTFLATQVGGGIIVGTAQDAYKYGWWVLLVPVGYALGLLVMSLGVGRRIAALNVATIAEIFEKVYGSVALRRFCSALSVVSLLLLFAAQIIATRKLLVNFGLDSSWFIIGIWGAIISYTVLGGLTAVIATDIVQVIFIFAAFVSCLFFVVTADPQLISTALTAEPLQIAPWPKLLVWTLTPMLFMLIEQGMAQRCIAGRSPRVVSLATLIAGILAIAIAAIPVFFGVCGHALGIEVSEGSSVLMTVVTRIGDPFFAAFIGAGTIAAIISTADSLLNAISSNIAYDFGEFSLKKTKLITGVIAVVMLFVSFVFDDVIALLVTTYEFSIQSLFVPVFASYVTNVRSKTAALVSVCCGVGGFLSLELLSLPWPKELIFVFPPLLGYFVGLLWEQRMAKIA